MRILLKREIFKELNVQLGEYTVETIKNEENEVHVKNELKVTSPNLPGVLRFKIEQSTVNELCYVQYIKEPGSIEVECVFKDRQMFKEILTDIKEG